jgi:hypothetical protein
MTAILIGLVVGLGFGLRSADPALADPALEAARTRALAEAEARADSALVSLARVLTDAIGHARNGSAETVAGVRPPAPELKAAASVLEEGSSRADSAHRAVEAFAVLAACIEPSRTVQGLPLSGHDLLLMASGLRSSADAATLFVEWRNATATIVGALGEAVASLDADRPADAITSLDRTIAPLALLDAWVERPPLLRYWMQVTGELIDAARDIADATLAADPAAQKAAAARYGKAAEAARGADNALAVTLSEEGDAVSVIQLQRLAAAASAVADARARLVAVPGS